MKHLEIQANYPIPSTPPPVDFSAGYPAHSCKFKGESFMTMITEHAHIAAVNNFSALFWRQSESNVAGAPEFREL